MPHIPVGIFFKSTDYISDSSMKVFKQNLNINSQVQHPPGEIVVFTMNTLKIPFFPSAILFPLPLRVTKLSSLKK